ncbi:MAG: hypothetical protein HOV79_03560 [Hamadaea sp.]|nr:hypothetical protein [Hamadaea sp.]
MTATEGTAPWQVNWQAYDVPRLADAAREDPDSRAVPLGGRALADLTGHAGELLQAAIGRLEGSWSDRSPAATEVFTYARTLAASLLGDAQAYHQLAADVGRICDELGMTRAEIDPLLREWESLGEQPGATAASLGAAAQDLNRRGRNAMGKLENALRHMRIRGPKAYRPSVGGAERPRPADPGGHHRRVPDFHRDDYTAVSGAAPPVPLSPPPGLPGVVTVLGTTATAFQSTANVSANDLDRYGSGDYGDYIDGSDGPSLTGGLPMTPFAPGSPVSMMPLGMSSGMAPGGGAFILPGPGVGAGGVLRKATMTWSAATSPTGSVIDGSGRGRGQLEEWARDLPGPSADGDLRWQVAQGGVGVITPGAVQGPGARKAAEEEALRKWYADLAQPWRRPD